MLHRILCLTLVCMPAFGLRAAGAPDRLSITDDFNVQIATDPQISPDGKSIVYVRQFADIMTDHRYSTLWMVDADGSHHRPLTTGNRSDVSPRWSPDGTRIAFIGEVEGHAQIMLLWRDTEKVSALTNLQEAPDHVAWSPDGRTLAYTALVPSKGPALADLPAAPPGAKWAAPPKAYDQLVYRFNGAGYLKPGYSQIFLVSADGGMPRQLTHGNFQNGGWTLIETRPVWTPDGHYLLASINRNADYQQEPLNTEIYEIAVADGADRPLTHRLGPDAEPAISPDGKLIAYTGFDDRHQGYQVRKLYLMKRDGSDPHSISDNLDRDVGGPTWAPDGRGIYFKFEDHGNTKVGFITPGGSYHTVVGDLVSGTSTYDSNSSFSVAKTGAIAFTYGNATRPGDVAIAGRNGPSVLTQLNAQLLAEKPPGAVEEISWASSKDGRMIEGWIVKPPGFDPGRKYPLILEIHGGPFANYGPRFDLGKQAWAARDYVVFYTNPRGSTSYGQEFGNLIHHAYPGDDFDDLNSGVDAVIARGFVDPGNLFVTGGSGGGVLTSWVIEHTDRFRAAAVLYPVINWYSFAGTSDIPFIVTYWFPGVPWENTEQYMQRSLTTLVGKVQTPSLIMTGEEDYRTPISEAEQFYTALKLRNVESVLVRVPGEPHGLQRFPSHRISTNLYVAGWFDSHKRH
jgi:acylaminoacyl-peptidase